MNDLAVLIRDVLAFEAQSRHRRGTDDDPIVDRQLHAFVVVRATSHEHGTEGVRRTTRNTTSSTKRGRTVCHACLIVASSRELREKATDDDEKSNRFARFRF